VTGTTTRGGPAPGWVRPPAVAGLFYPADPDGLRASIARHVAVHDHGAEHVDDPVDGHVAGSAQGGDPRSSGEKRVLNGLIVPHAGYRYSGATAGAGYREVAAREPAVDRVVLLGPAHRVPIGGVGVGVCTARAWRTPLGDVPVDLETCRRLVDEGAAVTADDAHAPEHSIEVQLPFLLEVLGPVEIVPLLVGRCSPEAVATVVDRADGDGDNTLVVVSSDLSHYLTEADARVRDEATRRAIVEGRHGDIGPQDACGCVAIAGMVLIARAHRLVTRPLAMATSAAATGDTSRVVGYGSFAFEERRPLTEDERSWLVVRARAALRHELDTGAPDPLEDRQVPGRLHTPGASFVTLEHHDELVGCIGSLGPTGPLWSDVVSNARRAAFDDPRFAPLTSEVLEDVVLTVSVLSALVPLPGDRDELIAALRPAVDGLVIEAGDRRGTFLPSVWRTLPRADQFVTALLAKADLPHDPWPTGLQAWRYTTDVVAG
jgi:MEMO1 family protein